MSSYKRFFIQIGENIEFEAFVATKEAYRIEKDFGGLYEDMFKEIICGEFCIEYINKSDYNSPRPKLQTFKIDGSDAIENIEKYCQHASHLFGYRAVLESSNIEQLFSFRFVGSDFALKEGADPQAYRKANDCFCSVLSTLSANNSSFGSSFMREQAGSIMLIADSTRKDKESLLLLKKIAEDIIEEKIDKEFIFSDVNGGKYKKAIESIADILKTKNLSFIDIDIQGNLYTIKSGNYLSQHLRNIYGNHLNIKGSLHTRGNIGLNSNDVIRFEVKSENGKIWTCHANSSNIVKKINDKTMQKRFLIKGIQKAPETIDIEKIDFIED